MKPVVCIHFTSGVGNNLFQYIYARLVAEAMGADLIHPELPVLDIPARPGTFPDKYPVRRIEGSSKKPFDFHSLLKKPPQRVNLDLKVYPEDFTLYTDKIEQIRSFFNISVDWHSMYKKDLLFHLRLGDRLIMKSTYKEENFVSPFAMREAIESFQFDELYIVTDMPVWRKITEKDVEGFTFHRTVKKEDQIDPAIAAEYFNALFDELEELQPNVRVGNTVKSDFQFMMRFNQFLFQHGTLAWWAAALSGAEEVALYGKWRGQKQINLGWTDFPGWRQWGQATAPPHNLKTRHLRNLAQEYGLKTFVETGTRGGTTLLALADCFDQMYSVEIIEAAYKKIQRRVRQKHIHTYLGDSAEVLPKILDKHITGPTLFWLDAHDGRNSTPILKELEAIALRAGDLKHVLVIDDSRYFGTEPAYPTKRTIENFVKEKWPGAKLDYRFDSIRIFL